MPISTTHLITFSPCGGSAKVSDAISRKIPGKVVTHNWTLSAKRKERLPFAPTDLVFLIFPVYGGKMPLNSNMFFVNLEGCATSD